MSKETFAGEPLDPYALRDENSRLRADNEKLREDCEYWREEALKMSSIKIPALIDEVSSLRHRLNYYKAAAIRSGK